MHRKVLRFSFFLFAALLSCTQGGAAAESLIQDVPTRPTIKTFPVYIGTLGTPAVRCMLAEGANPGACGGASGLAGVKIAIYSGKVTRKTQAAPVAVVETNAQGFALLQLKKGRYVAGQIADVSDTPGVVTPAVILYPRLEQPVSFQVRGDKSGRYTSLVLEYDTGVRY